MTAALRKALPVPFPLPACLLLALALLPTGNAQAQVNYGEALQKSIYFYEAQQSGPLPSWNRNEWRGDSALGDGSDNGVDLTGGWYDAGDHVKFGFPMAASATLLAWGVVDYPQAYVQTGQLEHIENNLRFVADYFVKAHTAPNVLWGQVGNGGLDHAWWGPAEVMPMARPSYAITASCPGSDLAGETAAALAAIAMVFESSDPGYAANLLTHAEQLYDFAYADGNESDRGRYSDCITDAQAYYNSWSGYHDELVWSALWLYRATGDSFYLNRAVAGYADLSTEPQSNVKSFRWTHAWDDKAYGSYVLLAALTGDPTYRADAERWLDYWTTGFEGQRITYTPGGLAFLDVWGVNRYAANTAFLALVYSDYLESIDPGNPRVDTYYDFAVSQIEYIFGDNPLDISYMIGYGSNHPRNPHHRTAHGSWANSLQTPTESRHLLIGALVGGPTSSDSYSDDRGDFQRNEVATDYNAAFTSALARLWLDFGGSPIPEDQFPPTEVRDLEYFVEAKVNAQGNRFIEIGALVRNHSAWPAEISTDLHFRYWVDLSEVFAAGYSLSDVTISTAFSQATSISGLTSWGDPDDDVYYVDVSFAGVPIAPAGQSESRREVQFRFSLPTNNNLPEWDNSNDPSWDDYDGTHELAPRIALYSGSELVWGEEPTPACGPGTGINCVPSAANASATTPFETPVTVTLSGSDSDGTIVDFDLAGGPANGSVSLAGAQDAQATYTPSSGFFGQDSFLYVATDDDGADSPPATVTITVEAPIVPAVSITSPAGGAVFETGASFDVAYTLSNAAGVRAYLAGSPVLDNFGPGPITLTAPSSPGSFEVELVPIDGGGTELAASDSVVLSAQELPPEVEILQPADGAQFQTGASLTVSYTVSGAAGVRLLFAGGSQDLFGTGNQSVGLTAPGAAGSYDLDLLAIDASGDELGVSDGITVQVVEPPTGGGVSCVIEQTDIWNNGYVLNSIRVTNEGGSAISAWHVVLTFAEPTTVVNAWNTAMTPSSGTVFDAVNLSYNGSLGPGQSTTFGFQGTHDGSFDVPSCVGQ